MAEFEVVNEEISDGLGKARETLSRVNERLSGVRSEYADQIEHYEKNAEDLRDQASCYTEAAARLRQFLYGNTSAEVPYRDHSEDNLPSGIT